MWSTSFISFQLIQTNSRTTINPLLFVGKDKRDFHEGLRRLRRLTKSLGLKSSTVTSTQKHDDQFLCKLSLDCLISILLQAISLEQLQQLLRDQLNYTAYPVRLKQSHRNDIRFVLELEIDGNHRQILQHLLSNHPSSVQIHMKQTKECQITNCVVDSHLASVNTSCLIHTLLAALKKEDLDQLSSLRTTSGLKQLLSSAIVADNAQLVNTIIKFTVKGDLYRVFLDQDLGNTPLLHFAVKEGACDAVLEVMVKSLTSNVEIAKIIAMKDYQRLIALDHAAQHDSGRLLIKLLGYMEWDREASDCESHATALVDSLFYHASSSMSDEGIVDVMEALNLSQTRLFQLASNVYSQQKTTMVHALVKHAKIKTLNILINKLDKLNQCNLFIMKDMVGTRCIDIVKEKAIQEPEFKKISDYFHALVLDRAHTTTLSEQGIN